MVDLASTTARVPGRAPRPGTLAERARRPRGLVWFVLPSMLLVVVFFVVPFVLNVPFAFSSWSGYSEVISFIGIDNWRLLWDAGTLSSSVTVTVIYAVIAMVVQNTVSLSLALALKDTTRVNSFYRSLFFIPVLISPLAAGYIWRAIVDTTGPLNDVIGLLVPGFHFAWLGHPVSALVTVAFVDGWKWSGIATLVYIAGLNGISRSLLEAAQIDRANAWCRFWHISFPLLAPAFTFNVVTTLIGALSAYDIVASTTRGGPGVSTMTLNMAVQEQFGRSYFGTASALSLTVTVLVITVAVPLIAWLRTREVAE